MIKEGKVKNKLRKPTVITIEEMVEETHCSGCRQNDHLYYLVNVKYSDGRGIGFRADSQLKLWAQLMQEIYL